MLNNTSQLIERNINRFLPLKSLLVMGPPADDLINILPDVGIVTTTDIVAYDYIRSKNNHHGRVLFQESAEVVVEGPRFDAVLIFMPKSKDELRFRLLNAHALLSENGSIFLVGAKKEGIASADKVMATLGGKVLKVDSARHCTLWVTLPLKPAKPFTARDWESVYRATVDDVTFDVCSIPGVFAHKRIDIGTEFLLQSIAPKVSELKGEWLDFACGAGAIAAYMVKANPRLLMTGVDSSALAVYCARRTFELMGAKGTFLASDGFENVSERRFDGIVTNPPFHTGVDTDYSITEAFIQKAKKMLKKNGQLFMVANNFLDYDEQLRQVFGNVEIIAANTKFNIYMSVNSLGYPSGCLPDI